VFFSFSLLVFSLIMKNHPQSGQMLVFALILVVIILLLTTALLMFSTFGLSTSHDSYQRLQAQSLAEAGIDQAIRYLNKGQSFPASEIALRKGTFEIFDLTGSGSTRLLEARGHIPNKAQAKITKKVRVQASVMTDQISFYYGVQVGDGGVTMSNNSQITGNLYSNGRVQGGNWRNTYIFGDVYVAGSGNYIDSISVKKSAPGAPDGNAHAHNFSSSFIEGDCHYNGTISGTTCLGSQYHPVPDPDPQPFPITEDQITTWKNEALAGGEITGDYLLTNFATGSLGPKKINGNLTIDNGATLTLTGALWVTGNISFSNNAIIKLDIAYGPNSAMIVADNLTDRANFGYINVANNVTVLGSGNPRSYTMMLSTKNTTNAISAGNNSTSVIFYAPYANIDIANNAHLKEVTGYSLSLSNGAQITYDTGLADTQFSTGPGGSWRWEKGSWQEIN
jgi:Tfp pilus assembly protein PilX